jgi:hypothetical protein
VPEFESNVSAKKFDLAEMVSRMPADYQASEENLASLSQGSMVDVGLCSRKSDFITLPLTRNPVTSRKAGDLRWSSATFFLTSDGLGDCLPDYKYKS